MTSRAAWLNTLATGLAVAVAVASGFDLPDRIPIHFNWFGEPDRYGGKWPFLLGVVGLLGVLQLWLRVGVPALIERTPARLLNLPNRDYWTATPARRAEATRRIADIMDWTGAFVALTTLWVLNIVRQAAETPPFLPVAPRNHIWVLIGIVGAATVLLLTAAARQFSVTRRSE